LISCICKGANLNPIPQPKGETGWQALKAIVREKSVLAALEAIHEGLGDLFQLPLPGFNAVMLVGPEANRFLLVEAKENFLWRADHDPVTKLLRHGVLVEDGEAHDKLRHQLNPSLHRKMLEGYVESMWRCTDQVCAEWSGNSRIDMLVEMRKIALLILTETLFKEDFTPQLKPLWQAVLRSIQYISPGLWLVWRDVPRPGYQRALRQMDDYLYQLIALRREKLGELKDDPTDMLGGLIASGMSDGLIRDQLLTMLIAGHDTSTALLAWALHLLTMHPNVQAQIQEEIDGVLGKQTPTLQEVNQLPLLEQTIKETLRLYPPIHLGSRVAATDIEFKGYLLPAGTRVLYSIYLSHRHKAYWPDPHRFDPTRFTPEKIRQQQPYTYMPFGGGARNCIGTAFAQVEAKVVLTRILQNFELRSTGSHVRPHMGATLEPHPGVMVEVRRRHA
jgi:cytochrome P450